MAIKLVQGDNLPRIRLTFTDKTTGLPVSLVGATVLVKMRAKGTTDLIATLSCTLPNGGSDGAAEFYFPGQTLSVEPGPYEGEVEVSFGGLVQTVLKPLEFTVRAQF